MNQITVSVIVPIYNVEMYLEECLISLEKQTLADIEVLMINDGSVDNSGIIAQMFEKRNPNFRLINRENGGLSVARNTGINMARGKYIYFLDSDDYLLENTLEILYNKAEREDLQVLKFASYTFREHESELKWGENGAYKYQGIYPKVYKGIEILQLFIDNGDTSFPSCCLLFTRRDVIEMNQLRFVPGIIHEDNLFHWQLLSLCQRVAVLNEPLYCRRYRQGSITQAPNQMKKNSSMCISVEEAHSFVKMHPEIRGETTNWYITSFVEVMIANWFQMPKRIKKSSEAKMYFKRVKPIVKQYDYAGNRQVKWFLFNYIWYRLMCKIERTFEGIRGRSDE